MLCNVLEEFDAGRVEAAFPNSADPADINDSLNEDREYGAIDEEDLQRIGPHDSLNPALRVMSVKMQMNDGASISYKKTFIQSLQMKCRACR